MSFVRETTNGLTPNVTFIRIKDAVSRKHSAGIFIGEKDGMVEYRSDFNGGVYRTPLANVRIDGTVQRRQKAMRKRRGKR